MVVRSRYNRDSRSRSLQSYANHQADFHRSGRIVEMALIDFENPSSRQKCNLIRTTNETGERTFRFRFHFMGKCCQVAESERCSAVLLSGPGIFLDCCTSLKCFWVSKHFKRYIRYAAQETGQFAF